MIRNTSEYYPNNAERNGLNGQFGRVSLHAAAAAATARAAASCSLATPAVDHATHSSLAAACAVGCRLLASHPSCGPPAHGTLLLYSSPWSTLVPRTTAELNLFNDRKTYFQFCFVDATSNE